MMLPKVFASALFLVLLVSCSRLATDNQVDALAAPAQLRLEPDGKLTPDAAAAGGRAVGLWRNADRASFDLGEVAEGCYEVSVRARADRYKGAPRLRLSLSGQQLGRDNPVETSTYKDQQFGKVCLNRGQYFDARLVNDLYRGKGRDRNIFVDFMTLRPTSLPSQSFPKSRNPLEWPFTQDSIWNMPVGSGAEYVPAGIGASLSMGMTTDEDVLILEPSAPLKPVVLNDAGWDSSKTRCGSLKPGQTAFDEQIPVPDGFYTDPGYKGTTPNMGAAILMPDGETIKQTQPFHVCPDGTITSQYLKPDTNLKTGRGIEGAHGGSGMSSIGGTVRLGELLPGSVIRHALKVNVYAKKYLYYTAKEATPGYRWPALNADGYAGELAYGGSVAATEMGALLALKPDFDLGALRTEPAKILARAFKNYGAYIVDDTAWDVYSLETEWSPDGRVADEFQKAWGFPFEVNTLSTCTDLEQACAWAKDMADIFSALYVVDNSSSSTVGGGGTPRQPLAPPFSY